MKAMNIDDYVLLKIWDFKPNNKNVITLGRDRLKALLVNDLFYTEHHEYLNGLDILKISCSDYPLFQTNKLLI